MLVIDDTGVEKKAKYVYIYYDHVERRSRKGIIFVSSVYADDKTSYPADFRIYLSKKSYPNLYKSKIYLALEMIMDMSKILKFNYVVFDSWYLCRRMHEGG